MENIYIPIEPDDNDEEHLVAMGSNLTTDAAEAHKLAHLQALSFK